MSGFGFHAAAEAVDVRVAEAVEVPAREAGLALEELERGLDEAHRALVELYGTGGQDNLAEKHAAAGREIVAGLAENLSDRTLLQRLTIP